MMASRVASRLRVPLEMAAMAAVAATAEAEVGAVTVAALASAAELEAVLVKVSDSEKIIVFLLFYFSEELILNLCQYISFYTPTLTTNNFKDTIRLPLHCTHCQLPYLVVISVSVPFL